MILTVVYTKYLELCRNPVVFRDKQRGVPYLALFWHKHTLQKNALDRPVSKEHPAQYYAVNRHDNSLKTMPGHCLTAMAVAE